MTLLGYLLQLATAGYIVYLGNTVQLNYIILPLAPVAFMVGQWMRTQNKRTGRPRRGFFQVIGDLIAAYLVGLIATAIFFGIGFALLHVLNLRPAEGSGRI